MKKIKTKLSALALILVLASLPVQSAWASQSRMLVPVGAAVGIQLDTQGVVVARAEGGKIQAGDVIVEINGQKVSSGEDVKAIAADLANAEKVELVVLRDGKEVALSQPLELGTDGTASLGLWLRDQVTGIGTVTYVDPESGDFGALGHGVNDADCGLCLPLRQGLVTQTEISSVLKGAAGAPGQLCGGLDLERPVGEIEKNSSHGIFGTMENLDWIQGQALEVAETSEIQLGEAQILSNVEGEEVESYTVEIVRLYGGQGDGRDMMLKVTDADLLEKTGGIVQGMSGSPIIQNGKLVGAVTHVLVSEPEKGYGIAIENMLEAAA